MNLTFEQFAALAKIHNLIPLYDELPADMDTPVSAFLKLKTDEYDFLFESVVGGEKWGRYSFLGTRPRKVYFLSGKSLKVYTPADGVFAELKFTTSPMEVLREIIQDVYPYQDPKLPRFFGGLVGYFSYDMIRYFEKIPLTNPRLTDVPDLCLLHTETVVVFDNLGQVMKVVCSAEIPLNTDAVGLKSLYDKACTTISEIKNQLLGSSVGAQQAEPLNKIESQQATSLLSREQFCDIVAAAKEYIEAGDIFQVVLSNRFELAVSGIDPFAVYRRLRRLNPSPYMIYLKMRGVSVVGASPEILVRLEDGKVTVRPIAGTRRRGRTEEEDEKMERELLSDPKELAEHVMLLDLGRNDVGRVAAVGSVRVEEKSVVERYSHVMHLVSHVSGELATGKDVFDVIAATFPAGTLSGAPKIRAMEIIEELEVSARGIYGGAIGYVSFNGNADLAIAIRTAVFCDDKAVVQAGAGIIYNSIPENEYQECVNKAAGVIAAIIGRT